MGVHKRARATTSKRRKSAADVTIDNTETIQQEIKWLNQLGRTMFGPYGKPKDFHDYGIVELTGGTSKVQDRIKCTNYLFLFIRKGRISLIGMGNSLRGDIQISEECKKFRCLLSSTGLILAFALPTHPHFHFLKYLNIRVHGVAQIGGKAFKTISMAAMKRRVPLHFVSEYDNYISKRLGVVVLNNPAAAGIPRKTVESLMKAGAARLVLRDRKAAKRDKKRNLRQSHITLSSQNKKDGYGYGGEPTEAAKAVPLEARDDLYSMSETMMEVTKRVCKEHLGEDIYHDETRNQSGCLALSRAAFGRRDRLPRRGIHESMTLSQSRLVGGKAGNETLAFHVDTLNDWRRGYCVSGSFSYAIRSDDGKSIDRLTSIFYTRKFVGDVLCDPQVDYPPPKEK